MKKIVIAVLIGTMMIGTVSCGRTNTDTAAQTESDSDSSVSLPNPMTELADMDEAKSVLGYDMTAPDSLQDSASRKIFAYEMEDAGNMLEVDYYSKEDETSVQLSIRKAPKEGESVTDISGVYGDFFGKDVAAGDMTYQMHGDDESVENVVIVNWRNGEYDYSIYSAEGLTQEEAVAIAEQIQ